MGALHLFGAAVDRSERQHFTETVPALPFKLKGSVKGNNMKDKETSRKKSYERQAISPYVPESPICRIPEH